MNNSRHPIGYHYWTSSQDKTNDLGHAGDVGALDLEQQHLEHQHQQTGGSRTHNI